MINYMKSEWYRIVHTKDIYLFTGVLAGLTLLMNLVLFFMDIKTESFPYATVSFSLSFLGANLNTVFIVGAILVGMLLSNDRRKGIVKNAIAYGISREKLFVGKSIVCVMASMCSLIVILLVYIGSAVLLLEQGVAPDAVFSMLKGIACILIMAAAFELLAVAFSSFFEKEIVGFVAWYVIMAIIPEVCSLIGLKNEFFRKIAAWMPANYLDSEVVINMSGWSCMWDTPEGIAKCLISGVIGLVVFIIVGLLLCKKQEV